MPIRTLTGKSELNAVPAAPLPAAHLFLDLFHEQANLRPAAVALTDGKNLLTYRELDQLSNRIARVLQSSCVSPGVVVGLYFERSYEFVLAALAVLKAGGAYLPLDPAYPADRVHYILCDADAPVLLTHRWLAAGLPASDCRTIDLDFCAAQIAEQDDGRLNSAPASGDLAYVIYTSGSTGRPKGVQIAHHSLQYLISWHLKAFGVTEEDRGSQLAGFGFDAAVNEIWPFLAAGASVHLADDTTRKSGPALRDWLVAQRITVCFAATVMAEQLLVLDWPADTALRYVHTGGDALQRRPPVSLPFSLINNYGPTECTVLVSSGVVAPSEVDDSIPTVGRPIEGTSIYVLDENQRPLGKGEVGELYLSGPGLATGYRNNPTLTAEKFLPNPFASAPNAKMYKTGDLGRYLPNGEIALQGRSDNQIKLRGFRIELDEIGCRLNQHPAVHASAVIAREDNPGEKTLVAYLVLNDTQPSLSSQEMREFVAAALPDYMIPSAFVRLAAMPVTVNGKRDNAALPAPNAELALPGDDGPIVKGPDMESRMEALVASLLGLPKVERSSNFFLLGGHSLFAAQLLTRLDKEFGVKLTLRQLFGKPTVASLASEVARLAVA